MSLYPKAVGDILAQWPNTNNNRVWCVDSVSGDDTYEGNSWKKPFASIQAAVNAARYLPGTTTIDDTKDTHDVILVAPGHYNEEELLYSGYNLHIVGLGLAVPGKDYGVSINYDGAADSTAAVAFSGSGNSLHNVHIYCDAALPALYIAGGDNNLIEDVVIECDGTNCTYGIQADSMKGSAIRRVDIRTPKTAGIYVAGGDNHYAIDGEINDCRIYGTNTGVVGILVDNTVTAYNFEIMRNKISVRGGGAGSKGIDINATGDIIAGDNYIVCHASATPAESAGYGLLNNHISAGGTVTDPFDDD